METANAIAGQVDLLPFQVGAAPSDGMQAVQGPDFTCSPFVKILERILQENGSEAHLVETVDNQNAFGYTPLDTPLPEIAASLLNGIQTQEASDSKEDDIVAFLRHIKQTDAGQSDQSQLAERFFRLLGLFGGQKVNGELVQEPDDSFVGKNETDNVREKNIEQEESIEAIAIEILAMLTLLQENQKVQGMPALRQAGQETGQEDEDCQDNSGVDCQNEQGAPEPFFVGSNTQTPADSTNAQNYVPDGEEISKPRDNVGSPHPANDAASFAIAGAALSAPSPRGSNQDADASQRLAADKAGERQEPIKSARASTITEDSAYGDTERAALEGIEERSDGFSGGTLTGQNTPGKFFHGGGNDISHHEEIVDSKSHSDEAGNRQAVPNIEQAATQSPQGLGTKLADKIESLLGKIEPEVIKIDTSSKSQSFTNGEGDSRQLGENLGSQVIMKTVSGEEQEAASFGNIVADRIARTVEHIAQTNRADLTLRLKIDGSESVLLEMKERAGTISIGIQCQDKGLVKALENQKEMMVRNLETKNLNTSISIASIGEDEQGGQRQWQRERHEKQRDNWNGTRSNPRSYFETLI